ncbi:hypothetical protein PVK06_027603 [Gossypium arboreum]|uniref:Uncharacterized protein n=1 Tax=Gossypium arboreum TaxID=29729 RepID=A0ABR0P3C2_GOSAR|nr:hypothetical protein PVK06_027603 [Gossypium arboreum]
MELSNSNPVSGGYKRMLNCWALIVGVRQTLEDQSARSMKSRTRGVDLRSFRAQMPKEHSHQRESTVDRSIIYSFLMTWFETYDQVSLIPLFRGHARDEIVFLHTC